MFKTLALLVSAFGLVGIVSSGAAQPLAQRPREQIRLLNSDDLTIALQVKRPLSGASRADVIYVHGSTFGADVSIYFSFDGRSWADALVHAGFTVWGFDFVGYGRSARYPAGLGRPPGEIENAMRDLRRVVGAVRQRNGNKSVVLLVHSRGGVVAARYASEHPDDVAALVLFAPVVLRPASRAPSSEETDAATHFPLLVVRRW